MIDIGNGDEVVVKPLAANGVLSNTGANSCIIDSELHLGTVPWHQTCSCVAGIEVGGHSNDACVLQNGVHDAGTERWDNALATVLSQ